jgi:hypothetical protein
METIHLLLSFDELIESFPMDSHRRITGSFTTEQSFRTRWENGSNRVNPHFGSRWMEKL